MKQEKESLRLIEEALKELESPKGSVLAAVQKISRVSLILEKSDIHKWTLIQLGDQKYVIPIKSYIDTLIKMQTSDSKKLIKEAKKQEAILDKLGLKHQMHYTNEEMTNKHSESGGGYANIGFLEDTYADFIKNKRGNNGTYYKSHLCTHINYVRKKAHEIVSKLYNEVKFAGTISNCFDLLKNEVDDRLLDLNPEIAEKLMLSFKSVSSNNKEEWSQALTTCRRLLEDLADELYPASNNKTNGRTLKKEQYVNRLWAFMDTTIESNSNKKLAKTHVDFLGSWLENVNKLANKGVHAELGQLEATKAVFHTYLVVADILDYLQKDEQKPEKIDINVATLDELEALLDINRALAKQILKTRIEEGYIDSDILSSIKGVGKKTIEKAQVTFKIDE